MKRRMTLFVLFALLLSSFGSLATAQDEVTLLIWADETRAGVIEELGPAFEEEYGVTLEVQQLAFGDIRDQLRIAGPAGEGPDVIIGAHDWLGELVANGLVAPVDLGDDTENFSPVALQAFTYDGQLYGVPYAVENIALFYNTELVPEPPTTWAEVRAISEELTDAEAGQYGFVMQQGDPYHFFPLMTSFGGYVFGQDEEGNYNPEDVGIDSEGAIAGLQFLVDMVNDGLIPQGLDGNTAQTLFQDGNAAMYITGPWNVQAFTDAGTPFAIAPIPAGEEGGEAGAPFIGAQGFMVSAFSENLPLAQVFLTEFAASEEVQQLLYERGGRPSALLSVMEGVEDPFAAAFAEASATGLPMPAIPEMSAVWSFWGDAVTNAMLGELTAEEAFTSAAEEIRAAIAGEE
ncbi:MAG: maltose ABC transporter substrate-binding protein [Anaerolineae bacterium]|nr:maltose ABC transporter substrate-binding protein [Anaerolineae bacterium]